MSANSAWFQPLPVGTVISGSSARSSCAAPGSKPASEPGASLRPGSALSIMSARMAASIRNQPAISSPVRRHPWQ